MATTSAGVSGSKARTVFVASAVGSAVEFYDFFAYGTAAALVFPTVFFPSLGTKAAQLASFAMLGAAFVARPAGAVVFGHFGDRLGRKQVLVLTLLMMGASTVGVGLVPDARLIGFAAPALVLSAESAPPGRSGLMGASASVGASLGFVLSSLTFLLVTLLGLGQSEAFLAWGWRVPFLLSGLLVLIGLYMRRRVSESPQFVAARTAGEVVRAPLVQLLRESPAQLALVTGSICVLYVLSFVRDSFFVSFAKSELRLPFAEILTINTANGVVWLVVVVVSGYFSDKLPRKALYILGLVLILIWSAVVMPVLMSGVCCAYSLAVLLSVVALGVANGSYASFLVKDFPVHLRYTGFSVTFNMAGIVGGALPPVLAAVLYNWHGPLAVTLMLLAFATVSLACAVSTRRFARN